MWPPLITPCECAQAGWCPRHQTQKPSAWFLSCRTDQFAFDAWERGEGPKLGGEVASVTVTQRIRCRHRHEEAIGQMECECCGGAIVSIPIFPCEKFERCLEQVCRSKDSAAVNYPVCQTCSEFSAREEVSVNAAAHD